MLNEGSRDVVVVDDTVGNQCMLESTTRQADVEIPEQLGQ